MNSYYVMTNSKYDGDDVIADYTVPTRASGWPVQPAVISAVYTHGPGVDEPLVWWRTERHCEEQSDEATPNGENRHCEEQGDEANPNSISISNITFIPEMLLADGLGSITGITGSASDTLSAAQQLIGSYTYDSFGNIIQTCDTHVTTSLGETLLLTFLNRYRYTSRESFDTDQNPNTSASIQDNRHRIYDPILGLFLQKDPKWDANLYGYVNNNPMNYVDPLGNTEHPPSNWPQPPPNRFNDKWKWDGNDKDPNNTNRPGSWKDEEGRPWTWHPKGNGKNDHDFDHWDRQKTKSGQEKERYLPDGTPVDKKGNPIGNKRKFKDNEEDPIMDESEKDFVLITLGGVAIAGTIIEDFLTGGGGILDDPLTIGAGWALIMKGW